MTHTHTHTQNHTQIRTRNTTQATYTHGRFAGLTEIASTRTTSHTHTHTAHINMLEHTNTSTNWTQTPTTHNTYTPLWCSVQTIGHPGADPFVTCCVLSFFIPLFLSLPLVFLQRKPTPFHVLTIPSLATTAPRRSPPNRVWSAYTSQSTRPTPIPTIGSMSRFVITPYQMYSA